MSSANLRSTESLKDIKTSLVKFGEQADMALTEVDMVARRVVEWLETEQPQYWKNQIRIWEEKTAAARNNLQAKRVSTVGGQRPDTTLEEKELRRCEAKLRHANDKARACKKWAKTVEDEIDEYRGRTAQLSRSVDVDIPKAMYSLDQMHASLESYMNLRQPSAKREAEAAMVGAQGGSGDAASVAQQVDDAPEDEMTVEELVALRANTPTRFKRDNVPVNLPEGLSYDDEGVGKAQEELIKALRIKGEPAESSQKVLLAEEALDKPRLYLERVRTEGNDKDSGWYIGPTEKRVKKHEALTVGELFEVHPALVAVMALPADHLAVVDGTRVIAVLNGEDEKMKLQ
ncbi:MAG: hypothetical protein MI757_08620 [Pirellulales bacterium]|nr:hypothetical protein [Pirellulales bacterium]